jgi:mono/diheme cytochrome c family protein
MKKKKHLVALATGKTPGRQVSLLFFLLICLPLRLTAQSKPKLSPDQRAGEGLFLRNCAFCHASHKKESPGDIKDPADDPKNAMEGKSIGPSLRIVSTLSDSDVRSFIMQGFPNEMPGFRYGLTPKEIDELISYLRTIH